MANNKRSLKHLINGICEELFADCVAASLYGNQKHIENSEALLATIVRIQCNFTARVSHPEPGMPAKKYYADLREKFAIQVSEVVDQISYL